jgi:protein TonB
VQGLRAGKASTWNVKPSRRHRSYSVGSSELQSAIHRIILLNLANAVYIYSMKSYYLTLVAILMSRFAFAGTGMYADTIKKPASTGVFTSVEQVPEFPGGYPAFANYVSRNLKYPDIARLIGINGRVIVTFVVDSIGHVTNVTPINCIGAGCEAEAAKVIESSPKWKPGMQDGRFVRVQYSVPISFSIPPGKITFKDLIKSDYGFIFEMNHHLYTLEEAQTVLGNSFQSTDVQIAEPFYNYDNNEKYKVAGKKGIYLLRMKL